MTSRTNSFKVTFNLRSSTHSPLVRQCCRLQIHFKVFLNFRDLVCVTILIRAYCVNAISYKFHFKGFLNFRDLVCATILIRAYCVNAISYKFHFKGFLNFRDLVCATILIRAYCVNAISYKFILKFFLLTFAFKFILLSSLLE